jgi:hypothetical protein
MGWDRVAQLRKCVGSRCRYLRNSVPDLRLAPVFGADLDAVIADVAIGRSRPLSGRVVRVAAATRGWHLGDGGRLWSIPAGAV